ncbi:MAG: T9SS type A sorting domain-containing protein, partial [Saprospiraceae bacterium]
PFNSVKQINIYQAQGNLIDEIITTENLINIDFSIYPTGLYFLRVQNDKIVLLNKMIVKL